jgi:wee1-like protein kinase
MKLPQSKRIYMLKREKPESMFSSPKTPSKKTPYRDIFVASTPFRAASHGSSVTPDNETLALSSDVVHPEQDLSFDTREDEADDRVNFVCKAGEGDFYEVFVNRKREEAGGASRPDENELAMLYKSRPLCIYDADYTAVKKSKMKINGASDRLCKMVEIEMLKRVQSSYVTRYHDHWESKGYLYIEVEYCNIGTLRDFINEIYFLKKSKFSPEIVRKMMFELASGLAAVHECGIVHLDIKPENVLLKSTRAESICSDKCRCPFPTDSESFVFKISDFNISRFEGSEIDEDGDKRYMAPEVLQNICTTASDIYSLGLIYLEVIREIILPKSGDNWMRLRKNDFRGTKPDRLCKLMLDMNYRRRPKAAEIRGMFSRG